MFARALLALWIACFAIQASPLRSDETVVFFPCFGWQHPDGTWSVEVKGWVFERERRPGVATAFLKYLGINEDSLSEHEKENFRTRSRLFLVDAEHGKQVIVSINDKRYTLPETDRTGSFSAELQLTTNKVYKPGQSIELGIETNAAEVIGSHTILLLSETGVSVISDIDDTIKVSNVRDRDKLLRNTFISDFQATPEMSVLYRKWAEAGVAFHYVSGSPIQLFPPLLSFLQTNKFPEGSFHLRNVNWRKNIWPHHTEISDYKQNAIEPILQKLPKRKFILVGDSGESDPEIYGDVARRHPAQIGAILIRDVTKDPVSRYDKAFHGVAREKWRVFDDPAGFANLPNTLQK